MYNERGHLHIAVYMANDTTRSHFAVAVACNWQDAWRAVVTESRDWARAHSIGSLQQHKRLQNAFDTDTGHKPDSPNAPGWNEWFREMSGG